MVNNCRKSSSQPLVARASMVKRTVRKCSSTSHPSPFLVQSTNMTSQLTPVRCMFHQRLSSMRATMSANKCSIQARMAHVFHSSSPIRKVWNAMVRTLFIYMVTVDSTLLCLLISHQIAFLSLRLVAYMPRLVCVVVVNTERNGTLLERRWTSRTSLMTSSQLANGW